MWAIQTGGNGWGNDEAESYTGSPHNVALDGQGHLVLTAVHEDHTGADGIPRHYTSARLSSKSRWSFQFGTLSARMRLPHGAGLWPAFWLLGTDIDSHSWPACGEIDIIETVNDARTSFTTVHGPDGSATGYAVSSSRREAAPLSDDFHTFEVERRPGAITTRIDGVVVATVRRADLTPAQRWVFDQRMFVVLNVAVGGDWPGQPTAATPASASMIVDWLRYRV